MAQPQEPRATVARQTAPACRPDNRRWGAGELLGPAGGTGARRGATLVALLLLALACGRRAAVQSPVVAPPGAAVPTVVRASAATSPAPRLVPVIATISSTPALGPVIATISSTPALGPVIATISSTPALGPVVAVASLAAGATAVPGGPATPSPSPASSGYPGQSNLVPEGYPTPNTAFERLVPGGPARDPGPLDWARPGPYMAPGWTDFRLHSFSSQDKLATTYYFYWHDLTDPARRGRYASGQFHRPPDPDHYSFLLPETHEREFRDMIAAGLDFVLPVYWGEPGHPGRTTGQTAPHYWSTEGLPAMVEALARLRAGGEQRLQIGMFYDTTILANADLTTPAGKEYFYVNVRDYFSRIPPAYWAAIDGKPVVWLYDTQWIAAFDQSSLGYLSERFAQDFGGLHLYVVREYQWSHARVAPPQPLTHSDGLYLWGAAVSGFNPDPAFTVAEIGPGFDNTAYCTGGPERNCFRVDREDGRRYERQLQQAIASDKRLIAIETWNEFSEGTDIQETVQTGRTYIDLTRTYLMRWRSSG